MVAQMLTPPASSHFSHSWDRFNAFHVQGRYLANGLTNGNNGSSGRSATPNLLTGILQDLASQGRRVPDDISVLLSAVETEFRGGLQNDRKYLTERVIQLAASLPENSGSLQNLSGEFIKTLWDDLRHPPQSYLGDEFKYRTADGSNNNILYPHIGKAGSRYARTVQSQIQQPPVMPDPSTIFDELFARDDRAREHPNKISSMLFYLASIIIHDIFRTSDTDPTVMENSSYLDLSPLYGSNDEQQAAVRTFKDGLLKPDAFSEIRLLGMPPGVCALLVCFNRFHNYVAGQLAEINEAGRFSIPPHVDSNDKARYEAAEKKRDNDLFQTARLITCGLYVNIILIDYVRTILNLNQSNSSWTLDPRIQFDDPFSSEAVPTATGNQVSVEFNLVYRWHSAISERDEKWTQNLYNEVFPGQDPATLSLPQLSKGLRAWAAKIHPDPGKRTFADLERTKDGNFEDAALVELLREGTDDVAGAFGARNVPIVLKAVEILGMEQARNWKVATLNEFRKFFNLEPHKTFTDINPDPSVAQSLEALYGEPDYVELYPGIVAEDAKEVKIPGSGLCPGFTISRTILSDAVALVRGDRFYTEDYTPSNLTNWGFNQIQSNPQVAQGGVMYKLLMRAFPSFYRANSVYAMYPFVVPAKNLEILSHLGIAEDYNFNRPSFLGQPIPVLSWKGVTTVLSNKQNFKVPWGPHTWALTGHNYMLSGDSQVDADQRTFVQGALNEPTHGLDEVRQFYEKVTTNLVHQKCHKLRKSYQLDAVKDVANISHAQFVAHMFHIPTEEGKADALSDQQLYDILAALFAYVFSDLDTASSLALREAAAEGTQKLGELVHQAVEDAKGNRSIGLRKLFSSAPAEKVLKEYGTHMIQRLSEGGKSDEDVVWTIIPTAAAAVATQAQGLSQMLDLYLSDEYEHHWAEIQKLALSDSRESFEKLKRYALEGYRLATPAFGLVRKVETPSPITIEDDPSNHPITVKTGDQVYVNFVSAGLDPTVFPDPKSIRLDRPDDAYIHHGFGPHSCLGRSITTTAMASQLRVFGRLQKLRRAPGLQGRMKSTEINGTIKVYMKEDWSDWTPYPTTMKVHFDGFAPERPPTDPTS